MKLPACITENKVLHAVAGLAFCAWWCGYLVWYTAGEAVEVLRAPRKEGR